MNELHLKVMLDSIDGVLGRVANLNLLKFEAAGRPHVMHVVGGEVGRFEHFCLIRFIVRVI